MTYFFTMRIFAQLSKADCFLESFRIGMKNSSPMQLQHDMMMLRKKAHCQIWPLCGVAPVPASTILNPMIRVPDLVAQG